MILYIIALLQYGAVVIGMVVPNDYGHLGSLEHVAAKSANRQQDLHFYTKKEALSRLHHFPSTCPRGLPHETPRSGVATTRVSPGRRTTTTLTLCQAQTGFEDSKPPVRDTLITKKGVTYHLICDVGGEFSRTVEWETTYAGGRDAPNYVNKINIQGFGEPTFEHNIRPYYHESFWMSSFCAVIGRYQCEYLFMGSFMGEIWRDLMTVHPVIDFVTEAYNPVAFESCREIRPDGLYGPEVVKECLFRHIDVYVPVD